MSPIAAGLDGLLALLLLLALGLGLQLNGRLKALREGQAGFAAAVQELNAAAARAEAGLAALKTASEGAHDDLLARIETARGLVTRLERAGRDAEKLVEAMPERVERPSARAALGTGGTLAAIAEGRALDREPPEPERRTAPPTSPRRSARPAFDEDLFETRSRDDLAHPRTPRGDR